MDDKKGHDKGHARLGVAYQSKRSKKPTKDTPSRERKFTADRRQRILDALSRGATYSLAAGYAGIKRETLWAWLNDPRKEDFQIEVRQVEAQAAMAWLTLIDQAAADLNWQAAAWKLERRYPEQYGRTVVQNEITGKGGEVLTIRLPEGWGQGGD